MAFATPEFLEWIAREEETLEPHILIGFDVILWNKAAQSMFGRNIPRYFDTDLEVT